MPDSPDNPPPKNNVLQNAATVVKGGIATVKAYVNLENDLARQIETSKEQAQLIERLSDKVVTLSERVARLETRNEEDRRNNEIEIKRQVSEFTTKLLLSMKDAQLEEMAKKLKALESKE